MLAQFYAEEVKKAGYTTRGDGTQSSQIGDWTKLAICRATTMTGILAENIFYTNPDDFKRYLKVSVKYTPPSNLIRVM